MDLSKLVVAHYPISEFDKFKDQIFQECAELALQNDNWSDDESKNNSLAYLAKNRLSYFTITTYEGKFINFSALYRRYNWVIGAVRGFSAESHGIRVLQSIWLSQVWPEQYKFAKKQFPNCKGYMVTFETTRSMDVARKYASRNTNDVNAVEFYKKCIVSPEKKIIQNALQYTMSWKF